VPRIKQWCTGGGGPDRGDIGWLVAEGNMTEGIGNGGLAGFICIGDGGHMAGI
jgi:hypothetical protein